MPTPEVLREIRRATSPHGVAPAAAFSLTPRQLERACAAGALVRVHDGVLVDPLVDRTPLTQLAIAVTCGGPHCGAYGRSAVALWKVTDEFPSAPEIVIPYGHKATVPGAVVHRARGLAPRDLMWHRKIRTTSPLRAVVEAAASLSPLDVAELIVEGRSRKLFEPTAISAEIDRLARPGKTGIVSAREAVRLAIIGDRPADSVLELHFHHGAGQLLPPYRYQHEVRYGRVRIRIDFAYPEVKLAIEVDGYEKRRSRESLDHDDDRQNILVLDKWTVLRFTWWRVKHDPAGVARDILRALASLDYPFAA